MQNGVSHASLSISPVEIKSYGGAECKRSKQDTYFTCKPNRFGKLVYEIAQGSTVMLHKSPPLVVFVAELGRQRVDGRPISVRHKACDQSSMPA